jgi:hypothetical protein
MGKLTPSEERAREAEYRWAVYAKTNDIPGPTRVKVHITRAPPGFAARQLNPPEHSESVDERDDKRPPERRADEAEPRQKDEGTAQKRDE